MTGFLHGTWHVPLIIFRSFYHGTGNRWTIVPLFLLTLTAVGGFYGYLRLATGSVWVVAFDVFWDQFDMMTVAVSPLTMEYLAGESEVLTLIELQWCQAGCYTDLIGQRVEPMEQLSVSKRWMPSCDPMSR